MKNWAKKFYKTKNKKPLQLLQIQRQTLHKSTSSFPLLTGKSLQQRSMHLILPKLSSWKAARGNIPHPAEERISPCNPELLHQQSRSWQVLHQLAPEFWPHNFSHSISDPCRHVRDWLCICKGYRKGSRGCSSCSEVYSHPSTDMLYVLSTWSSPTGVKENTRNSWLQGHHKEVLQVQIRK